MTEKRNDSESVAPQRLSRRQFAALSVAAGVVAATHAAVGQSTESVVESDVSIKTPSGTCDAALVHPRGKGRWPAVILFSDAFGLRPTMRDMAKRLAADGFAVLVPNPYYRSSKAPGIGTEHFNFANPADRAKFEAYRAPLTNDAVAQDAAIYMAFLDQQPSVNVNAKAGAFGYCMGGKMTVQAAASVPRIGAGASFHGGGLVTDQPDSPHLLIPKMKGRYYLAVASNDDAKQPEAKTVLADSFRAAGIPARIEVYPGSLHGWCVKDMPIMEGKVIYNEPLAERAWGELRKLFKAALV